MFKTTKFLILALALCLLSSQAGATTVFLATADPYGPTTTGSPTSKAFRLKQGDIWDMVDGTLGGITLAVVASARLLNWYNYGPGKKDNVDAAGAMNWDMGADTEFKATAAASASSGTVSTGGLDGTLMYYATFTYTENP